MNPQDLKHQFDDLGFVVVPELFTAEEIHTIKQHFMDLNAKKQGAYDDAIIDQSDPLFKYPRIVHPHRWDELSLKWMLDDRLREWTTRLVGQEPYAAQTMFYFKPPGSRGQALHQDQPALKVRPGTCLAAWMAVDYCDEENGCLQVVPHTQDLPELCPIDADTRKSFSGSTVPLADWMKPQHVRMNPGDVLFFNGQVIHGSGPNISKEQFRRALIAHYAIGDTEQVAKFYHPLLNFDGEIVEVGASEKGGPCGVWVDEDGKTILEFVDRTK